MPKVVKKLAQGRGSVITNRDRKQAETLFAGRLVFLLFAMFRPTAFLRSGDAFAGSLAESPFFARSRWRGRL
jgi:hypothetical protein